jgi:hypothetical protein
MPHLKSGDPLILLPSNFTPETSANLPLGVAPSRVPDGRQAYFYRRLAAIGLSPNQAQAYGLSADPEGNILQQVRNFNGDLIKYIHLHKLHKWEMLQKRKTAYNLHEEGFYSILHVTRRHPDILAADPTLHKYDNPYKQSLRPLPAPLAIKAYREKKTGGLIAFTEGYNKTVSLDVGGIESVAFLGITVYQLNPDLRNYLTQRLPDVIFMIYDADATNASSIAPSTPIAPAAPPPITSTSCGSNITPPTSATSASCGSPKRLTDQQTKTLSSRRNEDFNRSAQNFATELFDLFAALNHDCTICYIMGKPAPDTVQTGHALSQDVKTEHPKGVDDLIEAHGHKAVVNDLKNFNPSPNFQESSFFAGFTLSRSSYRQKLNLFFLKKHYRDWAEFHTDADFNQLADGFLFRHAHYRALSTGDLLDDTITYELLTDPFRIEVPTIKLEVNKYLREQHRAIVNVIESNDVVAIDAPTGSGKTTFLIKYARRIRQLIVVAMPTINLAQQVARQHKGYALTGDYHPAKVNAANDADLIVCTYDTLHQVPALFLRLLVIDEAHNFVNQYGQVYHGYKPFRAETLRKCADLLSDAKKTILLSGTMPPLLCQTLGAQLLSVSRTQNPNVRVFDIEADGSTAEALSRSLITSLSEINWDHKKLQVVFWNNTDQLTAVKDLVVKLGYLQEDQIATISRSHYNRGEADSLDDIITRQKVIPGIKLLLCTCLISEGVNIKNRNVGRIFTVGLRCEDTFRQFIARFRKLKVVNVFSILPTERNLLPDFFASAEEELRANIELAELQARQLERCEKYWQREYGVEDLPFLSDIEHSKRYQYRNHLLNLSYQDDRPGHANSWRANALHVLAAIHGRKVATANNCYFYTRLRSVGFTVLRVRKKATGDLVDDAISEAGQVQKEERKAFFESLLENLMHDPIPVVNALLLWYAEQGNRHGRASLQQLVPDLLDDVQGATGARYLTEHRRRFDEKARTRILCFARLHALGVADKEALLRLTPTEFNRQYRAAKFYFEQQLYDDPAARKLLKSEHKEEIRIKLHIARHLAPDPPPQNQEPSTSPPFGGPGGSAKMVGRTLVDRLKPLLSIRRITPFRRALPPQIPLPDSRHSNHWRSKPDPRTQDTVDLLGLSPARAINLVRDITHCTVKGSGRYRTIIVHAAFTTNNPPPLAALATNLLTDPTKLLPLLGA